MEGVPAPDRGGTWVIFQVPPEPNRSVMGEIVLPSVSALLASIAPCFEH